jgi:hypothetical protein
MRAIITIIALCTAVAASGQIYIDSYRFGEAFDADYQAVLTYATSQSIALPSSTQQIKQNKLVLDLKTAGVWAKLDVIYVFSNDSGSDFALINWKNPGSHTATLVNAPTFTTNVGFTGVSGSLTAINTNFNPSSSGVNYTLNDAGRFGYISIANGNGPWDGNTIGGSNRSLVTSTTSHSINSGNITLSADLSGTAWKAINRINATDVVFFNNTTQINRTATSTSVANENQLLLRTGGTYGLHTINFYAMGGSCVSENSDFRTAISDYISSL